jgi:HSP20 family protein
MASIRTRTLPVGVAPLAMPTFAATPFEAANRLARIMDETFSAGRGTNGAPVPWFPPVDVEETDDAVLLTADLPGLDPEDVEIQVENQVLTLAGSRRRWHEGNSAGQEGEQGADVSQDPGAAGESSTEVAERPSAAQAGELASDPSRRFHLMERRYGSFERRFTLPRTIRSEEISASFDRGVLRIHMPKAVEARSRRIEIRTGA